MRENVSHRKVTGMTEYMFRLRFKFPPESYIAEDAESLMITAPPGDRQIMLQSRPANTLKDTTVLDAIADGFDSPDAAASYGRKTRDALLICCALLGMGVEIEKHEELFDISQVQTSPIGGQTYIKPEDINGLIVYPESSEVEYVGIQFSARGGPPSKRFQEMFVRSLQLSNNLNNRLGLAFELFNSHLFETSIRSRFLQLVTIVECLARPKRQSHAIIDHLEDLIKLSKQHLATIDDSASNEHQSFIQRLGYLKRESISSACRNLIRQYLGHDAADHFKTHYDIRSKLVHKGDVSPLVELADQHSQLYDLVRTLLYEMISDSDRHDDPE